MERVASMSMGKRSEYIRIRADEELKTALGKAAARDVRTEADEARYLLLKALGLLVAEESPTYPIKAPPLKKRQ